MNKFDQALKNNNFICSHCTKCDKLVWPPSEFCNKCFSDVLWKPVSRIARLVEFSRKDGVFFCIAEFEEGIRVMGSIENGHNLQVGQSLILKDSNKGLDKFVFEPLSYV